MTDDESVCAARKPAVGDQPDGLAQPRADERCRRCQHFAHPRPALGPFVPDHDDITGVNGAGQNCGKTCLLRVEYASRSGDGVITLPADLCDRSLGREVAAQNHDVS